METSNNLVNTKLTRISNTFRRRKFEIDVLNKFEKSDSRCRTQLNAAWHIVGFATAAELV